MLPARPQTRSAGSLRRGHHPLEFIEKLVNKSSLTTKRVAHGNIITVGNRVLNDFNEERDASCLEELRQAIAETEARSTREMKAALQRQHRQMTEAQNKALQAQKDHFNKVAQRVAEQRNRLEAERLQDLKDRMDKERDDALAEQWEEAERLKLAAVQYACDELTKKLKNEFALEKELAICEALKHARAQFKKKLEKAIDDTTLECERLAAEEAARVAQLHAEEIKRHEMRYQLLKSKYNKEHDHRVRVESDFAELQTDYQRFMNYTDGKYHSDYMMSLRKHGLFYASKQVSNVSEYDERRLEDLKL